MPALRLKTVIRVSRPLSWLYLFGPFVLGVVAGVPHFTDLLDWRILVYGLYFLLPANLLAYGINDIFDYETDRLNERKVATGRIVDPSIQVSLSRIIVLTTIPFVLLLLATNAWAAGTFAIFVFLTVFYSAPPIRAKSKPVFDSLFSALYVLPGLFGYYLAGGTNALWTTTVAAILWSLAMHAYNAVPDIAPDKAAGIHTIATLFGRKVTLILCFALFMAAAILGAVVFGNLSRVLGVLYAVLTVLSLQHTNPRDPMVIHRWLPVVDALVGAAFFVAAIILRFQTGA